MLKVGLTVGIATGKYLVASMFAELGAHIIDADSIGHELMAPGGPAYDEIVKRFGAEILNSDQTVNRGKLAELAFDQRRPRIYELNSILHPGIIQRYEKRMEEIGTSESNGLVMLEAALLLEAGLRCRF